MQCKQDVKVVTIKRKIALKRPESLRSNLGKVKKSLIWQSYNFAAKEAIFG